MPVKIQPTSVIKVRLGLEPNGRVQAFLTASCYKHMNKYVPYSGDTGRIHLRENVDIQPDSITYESPYAHAQYVGFTKGPVRNYTTPGTGPYWDKRMISAEIDDVVKEVQDYINRGAK